MRLDYAIVAPLAMRSAPLLMCSAEHKPGEAASVQVTDGSDDGLLWSTKMDVDPNREVPRKFESVREVSFPWPSDIPDGPLGVGKAVSKALDAQTVEGYLEVSPDYLDGKAWSGDIGFDPMCMACLANPTFDKVQQCTSAEARRARSDGMSAEQQQQALAWMRIAELKHARLAMLAAAGWPLSELVAGSFLKPITNGRAPSLFNGALFDFPFGFFVLLTFGGLAFLEVTTKDRVTNGDYGFDPLGLSQESATVDLTTLKAKLPEKVAEFRTGPTATIGNSLPDTLPNIGDLRALREQELTHGRSAMIGITGFAVQEALWGNPVVEQTPWFFGR